MITTDLKQDEDPMCQHCENQASHFMVYEVDYSGRKLVERYFCYPHLLDVISQRPISTFDVEELK